MRRYGTGFWLVAVAYFIVMAFSTAPSPLYALYMRRDMFSTFTITLIYSTFAAGVVLSLFLAGHTSDWYGRRRVLVPAVGLSALSAAVFLGWPSLPGLFIGRLLSGLSVGAVTTTATAYLTELHAARLPTTTGRRAELVSTVANIGGLGAGALVAGLLADYVPDPLVVPDLLFLLLLAAAVVGVAMVPETRPALLPRPRYHPQRVEIPADARQPFFAACLGALISFAVLGLFTGLAATFLTGTLHDSSIALAGTTIFVVFVAGAFTQLATIAWPVRRLLPFGVGLLLLGLCVIAVDAWLPDPNLPLFLVGGILAGSGAGSVFRGSLTVVVSIAPSDSRAEALAALFLAGYLGLSVPVVGLGLALRHASARATLTGFALLIAAAAFAALPSLVKEGRSDCDEVAPAETKANDDR
jgi:predicted MFS family arabinose efflux permease